MRAATRDLREAISAGQVRASSFTPEQLKAIKGGKDKIPGMMWHHHQDSGRMQLISSDIHNNVSHIGGNAMSQGR